MNAKKELLRGPLVREYRVGSLSKCVVIQSGHKYTLLTKNPFSKPQTPDPRPETLFVTYVLKAPEPSEKYRILNSQKMGPKVPCYDDMIMCCVSKP